jgi:hypothetical protein
MCLYFKDQSFNVAEDSNCCLLRKPYKTSGPSVGKKRKELDIKPDGTHCNHCTAIYGLLGLQCKVNVSRFA